MRDIIKYYKNITKLKTSSSFRRAPIDFFIVRYNLPFNGGFAPESPICFLTINLPKKHFFYYIIVRRKLQYSGNHYFAQNFYFNLYIFNLEKYEYI